MKKFIFAVILFVFSFFLFITINYNMKEKEFKQKTKEIVPELSNDKKNEIIINKSQQTKRTKNTKKYVEIDPIGSAPLRTSPGGTNTITRIPVGYRVEIIDSTYERGGMMGPIKWYKVKYKNYTGWISHYVTTGKIYSKPK